RSLFILFFYFNAPVPTNIYTLSLHDALPISAAEASPAPEAEATKPTAEQIEPLIKAGVLGPKAEDPNVPSRPRNAHVFFGIYFLDRKSTRLNSSHVKISYAVFCLKKKKRK